MYPLRFALQNGAIPKRRNNAARFGIPKTRKHVLNDCHVTIPDKNRTKFIVSGLKQAEGRIERTVNDLDVFHELIMRRAVTNSNAFERPVLSRIAKLLSVGKWSRLALSRQP